MTDPAALARRFKAPTAAGFLRKSSAARAGQSRPLGVIRCNAAESLADVEDAVERKINKLRVLNEQ